jgi:osmotically-inducible protein OsmY
MHSHIDAENVDVQVRSGEVTLTGTVDYRGAKRDIEDLAEQILGVREVQNQIRVSRQDEPHSQSHATTTASSKKPTA